MEEGDSSMDTVLNKFVDQINNANKNIQKQKYNPQLFEMIRNDLPTELDMYLSLSPANFHKRFPRRSLLLGKPGVGKSTLPSLIASKYEYELQFIDCSLLATEYKNSGCQNLAKLFIPLIDDNKRKIVVLDEFNVITDKESNSNDGDRDMPKALWSLLDKLIDTPHKIIATANAVKKLPAPIVSRFGNAAFDIPLPSLKTRRKIVEYYLEKNNYQIPNQYVQFIAKNNY
jgi:AAA+ superfamily predicted ATPase